MRLLSVNAGRELPIKNAKRSGVTCIFKQPAFGPVEITENGLAGDTPIGVRDREEKERRLQEVVACGSRAQVEG